jgi:hypothetical protein
MNIPLLIGQQQYSLAYMVWRAFLPLKMIWQDIVARDWWSYGPWPPQTESIYTFPVIL